MRRAVTAPTMWVVMTKLMRGSEDGIRLRTFEADREYEIETSLAEMFIRHKAARPVAAQKPGKGKSGETKRGKGPQDDK